MVTERPSRFHALPAEIDRWLREQFCEDVVLRYQQAIGGRAVEEAARDQRMDAAEKQLLGNPSTADLIRETANLIDPMKGGGPYPSQLARIGQAAECGARFNEARCLLSPHGEDVRHVSPDPREPGVPATAYEWSDDSDRGETVPWPLTPVGGESS